MKKVALIYDRVNKWGGAERVLLTLHELFPDAPLYTSVYDPQGAKWARVFPKVLPSFLQHLPFAKTHHEHIPFLMPLAFEGFDFSSYDIVISVTSEAAKGIMTKPGTKHICYCLTPTRYLWSGYYDYFDTSFKRSALEPLVKYMRMWDKVAAQRPDAYIAISSEVQGRIKKYYDRDAQVVYPPTDLVMNSVSKERNGYLLVSRLVSYKKVDIAIKTFNQLQLPLTIVGVGSHESHLKHIAHKNIRFVGAVSDTELSNYYSTAKALIIPQYEDFGLVAVEAQMHGTPVIAYGKGGAVDIVKNGKTGILFKDQTVESLVGAVKSFEKSSWNTDTIQKNAKRFSKERFKEKFMDIIHNI